MAMKALARAVSAVLATLLLVQGACPAGFSHGTPPAGHAPVPNMSTYNEALDSLDLAAVIADIEKLLTDSEPCWPADFGNYGPFFIRLAWHCSGSYRSTDGRGGCGGGRMRFAPEKDWEDNGNLFYARGLLNPIKEKYGDALSWGDLFVTAGTTAIKSMGGPVTQFCVGRIDDPDGTSSYDLGPSPEQERYAPCPIQGKCQKPLGATTLGLIYVNPEGPVSESSPGVWAPNPDPAASAADVRDAFARMGMDDQETVALIGGGHAFGKAHGACEPAPGSDTCGTGIGNDTLTSGFEGVWTTTPTTWSNEFFKVLQGNTWEKHKGPGGHWQWRVADANSKYRSLMRLTTDIALISDDSYKAIVADYATNQDSLDKAFSEAWFKLTTRGGRWAKNQRCEFPKASGTKGKADEL